MKIRNNILLIPLVALAGASLHAENLIINAPDSVIWFNPVTLLPGESWDMNGGDPDFAWVGGGLFQAHAGSIDCSLNCRIEMLMDFQSPVAVNLESGARLILTRNSAVSGGDFALNTNSTLRFDDTTAIAGGNFDIAEGATLGFLGTTILTGGTFSGEGELSLIGDTTVNAPVTVGCQRLEFDGFGLPNHQVTLNDDLTINSKFSNSGSDNAFSSTLNINGAGTTLQINTVNEWEMAGTMNHDSGVAATGLSIDGAQFKMSGTTNITGGTQWGSRARITGTVNLTDAQSTLFLTGNEPGLANSIKGGTITGDGTLKAVLASLSGFGTIDADIDFIGPATLFAANGQLKLSGALINTPTVVGTLGDDAILTITNPWVINEIGRLEMHGGTVQGGTIVNTNEISGRGDLRPFGLSNNGTISASGGTLEIGTSEKPDLDGFGSEAELATHAIEALSGNLSVIAALDQNDPFKGTASVGPGRSMSFQAFGLGNTGTINLNGGGNEEAAAFSSTGDNVFYGTVNVSGATSIKSDATGFLNGSSLVFSNPDAILELNSVVTVFETGAEVSGSGTLVATGGNLSIRHGTYGASVTNLDGSFYLQPSVPVTVLLDNYSQTEGAQMFIDLDGAPDSNSVDRLIVAGKVALAGKLVVDLKEGAGKAGDIWRVIEAGTLTGAFTSLEATGVPAGHILKHYETADGVYVKLIEIITYAEWAQNHGLVPANDGIDDDPDGDLITNAIELLLGTEPLKRQAGGRPKLAFTSVDGVEYLSLIVRLKSGHIVSNLKFFGERSNDLETWDAETVVTTSSNFDPFTCSEVLTYRSTSPIDNQPREFLRIHVSQQ